MGNELIIDSRNCTVIGFVSDTEHMNRCSSENKGACSCLPRQGCTNFFELKLPDDTYIDGNSGVYVVSSNKVRCLTYALHRVPSFFATTGLRLVAPSPHWAAGKRE